MSKARGLFIKNEQGQKPVKFLKGEKPIYFETGERHVDYFEVWNLPSSVIAAMVYALSSRCLLL